LKIILDIYEEINKRHWLDFEFTDRAPSNEEDTLSDLLLIVKYSIKYSKERER